MSAPNSGQPRVIGTPGGWLAHYQMEGLHIQGSTDIFGMCGVRLPDFTVQDGRALCQDCVGYAWPEPDRPDFITQNVTVERLLAAARDLWDESITTVAEAERTNSEYLRAQVELIRDVMKWVGPEWDGIDSDAQNMVVENLIITGGAW
jgi:hypothetical protein